MFRLEFLNPEFFFLFIALLFLIIWENEAIWKHLPFIRKYNSQPSLGISTIAPLRKLSSFKQKIRALPLIIKYLALVFLIVALARPVSSVSYENNLTEALDIVIAVDISTSMLAQDFSPNRLESAKEEGIRFVSERHSDRFGIVVFAGEAYTQCPLTIDHDVVKNMINNLKSGELKDGTAVGVGMATAINRLKKSIAKGKIIILLTDGVNNAGSIDPLTIASIARELGIKIYSIGIGTRGDAAYPFKDQYGRTVIRKIPVEIDEALLKKISNMTGGKYFRATSNNKLRAIYREIDTLEKTEIQVKEYKNKTDEFFLFAYIAGTLLILGKILKFTYFRSLT